jgi:hypothetical protein
VIKITLEKTAGEGISGMIYTKEGYSNVFFGNEYLSLNYRKRSFDVFGSLDYVHDKYSSNFLSDQFISETEGRSEQITKENEDGKTIITNPMVGITFNPNKNISTGLRYTYKNNNYSGNAYNKIENIAPIKLPIIPAKAKYLCLRKPCKTTNWPVVNCENNKVTDTQANDNAYSYVLKATKLNHGDSSKAIKNPKDPVNQTNRLITTTVVTIFFSSLVAFAAEISLIALLPSPKLVQPPIKLIVEVSKNWKSLIDKTAACVILKQFLERKEIELKNEKKEIKKNDVALNTCKYEIISIIFP